MKNIVIEALMENNGDLEALNSVAVKNKMNMLVRPKFTGLYHTITGLTIAINDTQGVSISVQEYSFDGTTFSGILHFNIYDHFGLDQPDVEKIYAELAGFRAWFTLQHYDKFNGQYKPFITNFDVEVSFEGSLS